MKKIFLCLLLFSCYTIAFAQKDKELTPPSLPIDEDTQLITYKDVVPEKGSPQELYDRAMDWVKSFYKNTGEVIKNSDREKGVIDMRSSVRIHYKMKDGKMHLKNIVYYNFKLECRADRYRYTITNFNEKATSAAPIEVWYNTESPKWDPSYYDFLNQVDEQIRALINSLEEGMEPKIEKTDDW